MGCASDPWHYFNNKTEDGGSFMGNVKRVYVEKKPEYAVQAKDLYHEISGYLGIRSLENVRVLIRYDVENIDADLFEACKKTVFSEPQVDIISSELETDGAEIGRASCRERV